MLPTQQTLFYVKEGMLSTQQSVLRVKPVMTRKEKAAARSTKRDPSGFEHTEAAIASQRSDRGRGRGRGQPRGERDGRGGRGGGGGRERGRRRERGERGGGASQIQQASDSTTRGLQEKAL